MKAEAKEKAKAETTVMPTDKERNREFKRRVERLDTIRELGVELFPNDFKPGIDALGVATQYGELTREALEEGEV